MRRLVVVGAFAVVASLASVTAASAHPLGNFTVNHYDGVVVSEAKVSDHVVLDVAEIPTAQQRPDIDRNHDGVVDATEARQHATWACGQVARAVTATVGGETLHFDARSATFGYRPGAAGLQTSRLECELVAAAHVTMTTVVAIRDSYDSDRIGWHEFTAVGDGVRLVNSPVPQGSVSDELRHYPNDLLSTPLDVRAMRVNVTPGPGVSTVSRSLARIPGAGPFARIVGGLDRRLGSITGHRQLTVGVGLLAVVMSLLLGAAHAALPGHGKTVMAAYLAGKRGTRRDAVVVGATVTLTHTVGVLVLGLALTLSSSLAGDRVTSELGAVSGVLIVAVGLGLLRGALQRSSATHDHHHHDDHQHTRGRDDHHESGTPVEHRHSHHRRSGRAALVGMGVAGGLVPSPSALVVLLGAIALGRTVFGIALVITYGLGMAATLTGAGLLLVAASDRLHRHEFVGTLAARLGRATPALTGTVVTMVGLGLATRSFVTL